MSDASGNTCQTGTTWQNWSDTIQFQPACFFQPTTVAELTSILSQAAQAGKPLRVVGSGHSWSLGAVPGPNPYVPGAPVDAYLVDLTALSPENSDADASLKAFYFKDTGGTQYVSVPPGTPQGWFGDNLANFNDPLHRHSNKHDAAATGSMGPAPDINIGGFVANGCHGTGFEQPTVSDMVVAIEMLTVNANGQVVAQAYAIDANVAQALVQNNVTSVPPVVAPETMLAARVALGTLGVITKIIFALEPLFNVAALDEIAPVDLLFPANGDPTNLETLVTSTDYVEIFWFPYNTNLWVKRFSRNTGAPQFQGKVVGFNWIVSEMAALTNGLLGKLFQIFPAVTPLMQQIFFAGLEVFMGGRKLQALPFDQDWNPASDPIVPVPRAYLYQLKYFRNIVDLEHTVPVPAKAGGGYDFSKVMSAWQDAVNKINSMQAQGQYPISITVHLRFIKNSTALLSPAWQSNPADHTCYIEFISYTEQLPQYTTFAQTVIPQWEALGGLPHWAKIFQIVTGAYANSHQKLDARGTLQPFLDLRSQADPKNMFVNDFVERLLFGQPTAKQAASAAPAAVAAPAAQPTWTYRPRGRRAASVNFTAQAPGCSARGARLFQDAAAGAAVLVDESGTGHTLAVSTDPASGSVTYRLVTPSSLLAPREVFLRLEEVLRETAGA